MEALERKTEDAVLERVLKIWQQVVYKPKYCTITVEIWGDSIRLSIRYKVICSRTGVKIIQTFGNYFPVHQFWHDQTEAEYLELFFQYIIKIEKHEASEHFKYKDKPIFDPHLKPYDGKL